MCQTGRRRERRLADRGDGVYDFLYLFQGAFADDSYHTGHWPHEGVDFTGKRVDIIGTGATAIQAIPLIAQQADHLTVFQRTANYAISARNGPADPEVTKARKAEYDAVWDRLRQSYFGFEHYFIERSLEDSPEERERELQSRWDDGGFGLWLANYQDMFFDKEANDAISEWVRERIQERVDDPAQYGIQEVIESGTCGGLHARFGHRTSYSWGCR